MRLLERHAGLVSVLSEPRHSPARSHSAQVQCGRTPVHAGFSGIPARTENAEEGGKKGRMSGLHPLQAFCRSHMSCATSAHLEPGSTERRTKQSQQPQLHWLTDPGPWPSWLSGTGAFLVDKSVEPAPTTRQIRWQSHLSCNT